MKPVKNNIFHFFGMRCDDHCGVFFAHTGNGFVGTYGKYRNKNDGIHGDLYTVEEGTKTDHTGIKDHTHSAYAVSSFFLNNDADYIGTGTAAVTANN